MSFQPLFVPGGVYLRTPTGELISRLDKPGSPFVTLDEARDHADWLGMVLQYQRSQYECGLAALSHQSAAGDGVTGSDRSAPGSAKLLEPHTLMIGE